MADKSKVKSLKQKVNGLDFYCEIRGSGPTIAFVPAGDGDCGSFAKVADALADEFTVFTLDMRGMSRSERPANLGPMTEKDLASDVVGLIKALNLAPATFYGCSSGGQAVLSIGVYYPEVARNLMVHEAALQNDCPVPGAGMDILKGFLDILISATGSKNAAVAAMLRAFVFDEKAWDALGTEFHKRMFQNGEVWLDLVIGSADQRTYTAEELAKMPPLVFSVGLSSPAWLAEANLRTARRANAEVVWLPGMHYPQVSHPELLAKHIREHAKKYLQ